MAGRAGRAASASAPVPALLLGVAILLVLAIPVLDMQLGQQDNGQLPKSTTDRQAYDLLTKGFGPGTNGPLLSRSTSTAARRTRTTRS